MLWFLGLAFADRQLWQPRLPSSGHALDRAVAPQSPFVASAYNSPGAPSGGAYVWQPSSPEVFSQHTVGQYAAAGYQLPVAAKVEDSFSETTIKVIALLAAAPLFTAFAVGPDRCARLGRDILAAGRSVVADDVEEQRIAALAVGGDEAAAADDKKGGMGETLVTASYFALWYLLNVAYNIYNKKLLNVLPMPWTVAMAQIVMGIPYAMALWAVGVRPTPKVSFAEVKTLTPVALANLGTHIGAVISLSAGAVSFVSIVKASEPAVSALLSGVLLGQVFPVPVYATLLPIIFGVALASLKELSFTWLCFGAAMLSNVSSALRAILAKKAMSQPIGENMTNTNLFAVQTMISAVCLVPIWLLLEPPTKLGASLAAATATGAVSLSYIAQMFVLSGLSFYFYNEVAFMALGRVQPITHAVGNTIKRVVIIIASVIAFKNPISPLGIFGSTITIIGTLLYSIVKGKYSK
jgi:solute carrier family 35 protein E1